jgi:hypothetical protein
LKDATTAFFNGLLGSLSQRPRSRGNGLSQAAPFGRPFSFFALGARPAFDPPWKSRRFQRRRTRQKSGRIGLKTALDPK